MSVWPRGKRVEPSLDIGVCAHDDLQATLKGREVRYESRNVLAQQPQLRGEKHRGGLCLYFTW